MKINWLKIVICCAVLAYCNGAMSADTQNGPKNTAIVPSGTEFWVAPYHPSYQWQYLPASEVPWDHMTHLILGYLWPENSDNGYTLGLPPSWSLGWDSWRNTAQDYIDARRQANRKVTCMLGGAGSNPNNIWNNATSEANVAAFAQNIKSVLQPIGFDGVDLDWEDSVDYPSLVRLAQEIRWIWVEAIITIPTGPTGNDAVDLAPAKDIVDAFMPMTYMSICQWGGWLIPVPLTPLYCAHRPGYGPNPYSVDYALEQWITAGVPASKIVMGVGGFGSVWGDSNGDNRAPIAPYCNTDLWGAAEGETYAIAGDNVVTWEWVKQTIEDHPELVDAWDHVGKCSYWHAPAVNDLVTVDVGYGDTMDVGLIFYETTHSMFEKVNYCNKQGMKGMMFWTLSQMMDGNSCPILEAAKPTSVGSTYYVSTAGDDDGSGSSEDPWQTLQHAADIVSAGDKVIIRSGTYSGFRAMSSGASGAVITFRAEDGASVILDSPGPDNWHGSTVNIEGESWWALEGLEITGAPTNAGVDIRLAEHVTVRNCFCHDNHKWGIFTAFVDYFTAESNECSTSELEHGIYHSNSGDYAVIRYNTCHHNYGCGIQINADPSMGGDGISSFNQVTHNIAYENGAGGGAAINLASVRDSLIANNLIYNNSAGGIAAWDDGQGHQWGSKDNRYYNNTVHMPSEGRWAINLGNGSTGCDIKNNILIHESTSRGGLEIDSSSMTGLESDTNIITRVSVDETTMSLSDWQTLYGQDAYSEVRIAAELFISPGSDYHLLDTAFARNNGQTIPEIIDDLENRSRPQGNAYDIGCYEYEEMLLGDLNLDGKVDAEDARILAGFLASNIQSFAAELSAADLNGDGGITVVDLAILMSIL